ncbi:hypothetical protein PsYK624_126570 [Phanerochaete sordida]|uniref:Uncharacterized protein n=1 Tax=Phanerochaete sordida TaxID=48140 RepID=A0A9P3LIK4_9APHY|nr:hypothetical protein PsYK624_126570 [Phanerochaete sordida]
MLDKIISKSNDPIKCGKKEVQSWGFKHVFTWTDGPNTHYKPHTHSGLTTHLIVNGDFTMAFPEDGPENKTTYGPGSRVDVPAGKVHEVWVGEKGCTYVIGECA